MTVQMVIALAIVILMIAMIISDKFAFGAPPLLACALMVITGISTIQDAFAGFTDTNVIMIAGFMAVMAGLQKTRLMVSIRSAMAGLAARGGFSAYLMLILVAMSGASLMSGTTGYYVMVLTILSTIPYNPKLPNSKLMLPVGFGTGRALIPVSVAFFLGLSNSLLESNGVTAELPMMKYSLMVAFMSFFYLVWSLFAYKLLPDFDITNGNENTSENVISDTNSLPKWKEYVVYIMFAISVIAMMKAGSLGEIAYITPCIATAVLGLIKVFDFKEIRNNLFSPLIIMMASVIGVANALANTGFTAMVGEHVAKSMGSNVNGFVLVLVFCFLISACATLTGSSIGTAFVFVPIGIATCVSLHLNPAAIAAAGVVSAWGGGFLPIDGLPAMILGLGNYKLTQFLKFSVPMYICQITGLAIGAVLMFPL